MNDNTPKTLLHKTLIPGSVPSEKAIGLALCLTIFSISPTAYSEDSLDNLSTNSGSSMINRAPLISSKLSPSNLDRISKDISNISESLNNIVTDQLEDEVIKEEPVKTQPVAAKPEKAIPKITGIARPVIQPTKPLLVTNERVEPKPVAPLKIITNTAKEPETIIAKKDEPPTTKPNKYLKKAVDGKILADTAETWSCVENTNNGLIWEVKSKNGGVHDKNNSYSWFQPSATEIPQGRADGGQCKGDTQCDTLSYVQTINQQNYCGYSDWRLPTREEMLSIVTFENTTSSVTINSDYFPETLPSWYWTASSNANHPEHAWYVLFRNGITINDLKERPKHVRLVRSNNSAQRT